MIESKSLQRIMELGYDVGFECKGKGREYEMTFEASARRIQRQDEDYREYLVSTFATTFHAVGDTIEETANLLLNQIESANKL